MHTLLVGAEIGADLSDLIVFQRARVGLLVANTHLIQCIEDGFALDL